MELLFAGLGGALLGFIFHYALPAHETRGWFWAAGWGACSAVIVWEALIWLNWKSGDGWIWAVTLVVAALTAAASVRITTVRRREADKEMLDKLFRGLPA